MNQGINILQDILCMVIQLHEDNLIMELIIIINKNILSNKDSIKEIIFKDKELQLEGLDNDSKKFNFYLFLIKENEYFIKKYINYLNF